MELTWDATCRGTSLRVQQGLISEWLMNMVLRRVEEMECVCESGVSVNLAWYDYALVEESIAALAILWRPYQESPYPDQLSLVQIGLHHLPFVVEWQPEPWIQLSFTSYLSHRSSRPRLPSLVSSVSQASSASAENAPCDAVSFRRLCPAPSLVHHLRSACPHSGSASA